MTLSDTKVKNAKPRQKRYKIADSQGLHLVVTPTGSKFWRLKYFFYTRERLLALGVYPEVTLSEAREKRDQAKKLIANGIDPNVDKRAKKIAKTTALENSFEAIAREWLEKFSNRWTDSYKAKVLRRLECHVFPWMGHRPIMEITAPELLDVLRRLEKKNKLDSAHRIRTICGKIFRYAIATKRGEHQPSSHLL